MAKAKPSETVQIRMKTLDAGPDGIWPAGSVRTVAVEHGKEYVEGGYAEYVETAEQQEGDGGDQ